MLRLKWQEMANIAEMAANFGIILDDFTAKIRRQQSKTY
jgi:hypothetical protein